MKRYVSFFFLFCTLVFILCTGSGLGEKTRVYPDLIDRTEKADTCADFHFDADAQLLEIWMPDIRDADAAILLYGGDTWMIDCGDERAAKRLVLLMKQLGIQKIDRLFNSHPHHDHLGGLRMTAEAAEIGELLICFPEDSTVHMQDALAFASEAGIRVSHYGDEDHFSMGDGAVTLHIWQKSQEGLTMNDLSAQTMVRYGERTMLFTADAEKPAQRLLLAEAGAERLKADILKYPHHGKLTMEDAFLNAVGPQIAVITNYRGFGESWRYLRAKGIGMVYTNRDRLFLHLVTDGVRWLCEYVPVQ